MSVNAIEPTAEASSEAAPVSAGSLPKPMSFKDLNNLTDTDYDALKNLGEIEQKNKKAQAPQEKAGLEEAEGEALDSDDDDDSDIEEGDDDAVSDSDDADADDTSDGEDEEEGEAEVETEEGDDKEVFLEQKVNGKVMKFTEEEVRRIVASGAHNLEKMNQFETQKKQMMTSLQQKAAELSVFDAKISPIFDKVKKKDLPGAILDIAKEAGINKLDAKRNLLQAFIPVVAKRLGLPQEWVQTRLQEMKPHTEVWDRQEEAEFYKEEVETLRKQAEPKAPDGQQLAYQKIQDYQLDHGISKGELNWAVEFIEKSAPEGQAAQVTPEMLRDTVLMRRITDKVFQAIRAVRPTLQEDEDFVDLAVAKVRKNPEWGVDRVARWVDKKARQRAATQSDDKMKSLQKDVSRKALKEPKSRFANPNAGQKKPMRFADLSRDDLP